MTYLEDVEEWKREHPYKSGYINHAPCFICGTPFKRFNERNYLCSKECREKAKLLTNRDRCLSPSKRPRCTKYDYVLDMHTWQWSKIEEVDND